MPPSASLHNSIRGLLFSHQPEDHEGRRAHGNHAEHGVHPDPPGAGLGPVEALGVHHRQRDNGVGGFSVLEHRHLILIDLSAGCQQRGVAPGAAIRALGGDLHGDIVPEQRVALVGLDLRGDIGVVLHAFDDDMAVLSGDEDRGLFFVCGVAGDIVDAVLPLRLQEVVVHLVLDDELHVLKLPGAVGKLFGQVDAVGVNMGVVLQHIVILGACAPPGQLDGVGIAGIAVHHALVRLDGTGVSNAHEALGEAAVNAVGSIDRTASIDLGQACPGHFDGHGAAAGRLRVGHGKLAVVLAPGRDLILASVVPVELDHHVALVVADAGGKLILKGVAGQVGGLGGDGGQMGKELVFHPVAVGGGGYMIVAVQNVIGLALVIAGVGLALPDGLFQIGHTCGVLGIDGHVVIPLVAVNGRGGQREQEGIAGAGDHIRDLGFHDHVQTQG